MSTYKTRLGAVLELDSLKEKDIINNVEYLKSKHKLSAYTTALYRVAHNHPEVEKLVRQEMGGLPNTRDAFFESIKGEINNTIESINKLQDNLIEQKATLLYWQSICPAQKLDNTALGILAIQNHLKEIKKLLYTSIEFPDKDDTYVADIETLADRVLNNVVEQLTQMNITSQQLVQSVQVPQYPTMPVMGPMQTVSNAPILNQTDLENTASEMIHQGPKIVEPPKEDTVVALTFEDETVEEEFYNDLEAFCGI